MTIPYELRQIQLIDAMLTCPCAYEEEYRKRREELLNKLKGETK